MPYITQAERKLLESPTETPRTMGQLCYWLCKSIVNGEGKVESDQIWANRFRAQFENYVLVAPKLSWQIYGEIMGAVAGAAGEICRRGLGKRYERPLRILIKELGTYYGQVIGLYEDTKIAANGDVF